MATYLTNVQKNDIRRMHSTGDYTVSTLVEVFKSSQRSIRRVINAAADFPEDDDVVPDQEIIESNVQLAKKTQKLQDLRRIENKAFREHARVENAITEYTKELKERFSEESLSSLTVSHDVLDDHRKVVGVVQLSDVHFNEQIHLDNNIYNFHVASTRIKKLIMKAKTYFKAFGVVDVVMVMTGDMLNSDRRLDELLENATNRSQATFIAVDILQQAILDLNRDFNVTVASISGNEGRVNKDLGWIDDLATDNYDIVIHNMLKYLFKDSVGVEVLDIINPTEQVIDVNGFHFLLMHGHNGVANNARIESGVAQTMARFANKGVKIDYILMGHIHSSSVGDFYARSSGLPGANAYSERALNLTSKAAQNIFIVDDQSIDGVKVDLQETDGYTPYQYHKEFEAYHSKSAIKARQGDDIVIHKIVI